MADDLTPEAAIGLRELDDVLEDLETLLKNNHVISALTTRGVNTSLAITALYGLRSYLQGDKEAAVEDLGTAVEEISSRASIVRVPKNAKES